MIILRESMVNFILFLASLLTVVKSANLSIRYSSRLTESMQISAHVVGFLLVAGISILPETFIAISSAFQGIPSFGLSTLFGSNVADLTIVFAIVTFFAARTVKVQSKLLRGDLFYILVMSAPIFFGLNGYYSRIEGVLLILIGILFYSSLIKNARHEMSHVRARFSFLNLFLVIVSIGLLLFSAHFTVTFGVELAHALGIHPTLIGMFVVGLGTTLPELFFSINAVRNNHADLALGDILGTVMTDATIVVGLVAVLRPFSFEPRLIYITGLFMLSAVFFLFDFMKSDKVLSKKEGLFLALFYFCYVAAEFIAT